jgi:hypothetical protein
MFTWMKRYKVTAIMLYLSLYPDAICPNSLAPIGISSIKRSGLFSLTLLTTTTSGEKMSLCVID